MSRFNSPAARPVGRGPIASERVASGTTFEGAPGFARDLRSELFLLAVTNMVGTKTFYETAEHRDTRFEVLVQRAAVEHPEWTVGFLGWLRGPEANMRSASLVAAAEFVRARLTLSKHPSLHEPDDDQVKGYNRRAIDAVLQRADEPGEFLAYWTSRYGRSLPMPVKRGVADACRRLYTERALLKYDTASHGYRFADVLDLCHPTPKAPWQGDLFAHALDRRHNRPDIEIPDSLAMLQLRAKVNSLPVEQRRDVAVNFPQMLREAGMTWEALASWLQGPMDAAAWESVIPSMGFMALLRNLRNFDEAGVSSEIAGSVASKLGDPAEVSRSRQLPMRFLSAYRAAPSLRWAWPLETAINLALGNISKLAGNTLILVDTSSSMSSKLSDRSDLLRWDAAAMFALAVASRCDRAEVVSYSSSAQYRGDPRGAHTKVWNGQRGESLLKAIERWEHDGYFLGGGTDTALAARRHYLAHDRVILLTDEQAGGWSGPGINSATVLQAIPATVPCYTWNLAGYERGHAPEVPNRHTFGGLTDSGFRMIPLLEQGRDAHWPWEVNQATVFA